MPPANWLDCGRGGQLGIEEAAGEVSCVEHGPLWCRKLEFKAGDMRRMESLSYGCGVGCFGSAGERGRPMRGSAGGWESRWRGFACQAWEEEAIYVVEELF